MMRTIIVYSSQYGTVKRYAEALAGRTESEIRSYEDPLDLVQYSLHLKPIMEPDSND